ncbi:MAG: ribonuclease III [Acidobacteriia bacterium]|nr:ribonuclease III [Terriglobia bacterium]
MRRKTALLRLQRALGYRFADTELLEQALRHRSAAHEQGVPSFERLEFLGDAALSHAVAALLFARWADATEGQLTRARAALVREGTLASLAERLGLPAALELGSGLDVENPGAALLADALEAVLGAVLLDGGWRAFRAAIARSFAPLLASLDPAQLPLEEPKSTLQELAQRHGNPLPVYREVEVRGPAHRQVFVFEVELDGHVIGWGEGSSKKAAQQEAARNALEALGNPATSETSD